jgi:hypothetical protein
MIGSDYHHSIDFFGKLCARSQAAAPGDGAGDRPARAEEAGMIMTAGAAARGLEVRQPLPLGSVRRHIFNGNRSG